jgi:hypothetical protein
VTDVGEMLREGEDLQHAIREHLTPRGASMSAQTPHPEV